MIKVESGSGASLKISPDIIGFGTIELGVGAPMAFSSQSGTAELGSLVGRGQTFEFSSASIGSTATDLLLPIDTAKEFQATNANFANTDTIDLKNTTVTSDHFSGGVLTLSVHPGTFRVF